MNEKEQVQRRNYKFYLRVAWIANLINNSSNNNNSNNNNNNTILLTCCLDF